MEALKGDAGISSFDAFPYGLGWASTTLAAKTRDAPANRTAEAMVKIS